MHMKNQKKGKMVKHMLELYMCCERDSLGGERDESIDLWTFWKL